MNARSCRIALLVLTVPMAAAAAESTVVRYPIRHLLPEDAILLVRSQIPEAGQGCHFSPETARDRERAGIQGTVNAACESDALQARIKEALAAIDAPPPTHRFHIAVLAASRKEGTTPELPPGEAKALADFKKVMTYRSFQMESETILQTERGAQGRFDPYVVELVVDQSKRGGVTIDVAKFQLRAAELQAMATGNATHVPTYIETSFSIKSGETIVLGTTVSDQQARVVLVTALP